MAVKTILRLIYILIAFTFVLLGGQAFLPTYAAVQNYSNVLTDLKKDESFNADDYPIKQSDYSLQVIQIAESTDGELFLYTYQPCQPTQYLVATSVNMSLSESVNGTELYALTLLSSSGVFCKYLVNGVTVSTDETRYYNISSIFRPWIAGEDKESGNNNTINEKSYDVGKCYKVTKENGELKYDCKRTEVIKIINPYVDYLEYSNGFHLYGSWCDSHYVAFSTDKKIDFLMEAEVYYIKRSASRSVGLGLSGEISHGKDVEDIAKLTGKDTGENVADGWFAKKYEWERIQTVEEFKATEDLTDETIANLEGKEWVLRFIETDRHLSSGYGTTTTFWTEVSNVTILRLKFVTPTGVYNLGTVSDKVTGDDVPGNNNTNENASLWEWLERLTGVPAWVWKIIIYALPFIILLPILSAIFPVVGQILLLVLKGLWLIVKYVSIGIWYVISSPFRLIIWLVNRGKDGDDGEQ